MEKILLGHPCARLLTYQATHKLLVKHLNSYGKTTIMKDNHGSRSQRQATQSVWQQESAPVSTKETVKLQRLRNVSVCEQKCASLLHDLLIKQEIIIEQQRNLIRMVQDPKTTSARENTAACQDTIACDMNQRHLPIEDLPSLMALENDLRSSPDKRKKLVLELGLIGGADIKDTVWCILKQTIKNDLAKTVNWRGVNGKTGFQSLQLKNVVTEAARRNPVCSQATEMESIDVTLPPYCFVGEEDMFGDK
ncbi:hypothetical protein SRHO_G00185850 [Serrasalmus rhombeus]